MVVERRLFLLAAVVPALHGLGADGITFDFRVLGLLGGGKLVGRDLLALGHAELAMQFSLLAARVKILFLDPVLFLVCHRSCP